MDRGAWQATVCGVATSQTQLSDCAYLVHGAQVYILPQGGTASQITMGREV